MEITAAQAKKEIKKDVELFAEAIKGENWDDAFDVAVRLNAYLKSEEVQVHIKDMKGIDIPTLKAEIVRYFYNNGEFRKYRGALLKKADKFLATLG